MDPDLPLIQALQAGDDSALDQLIGRHREPLFRFVYRYLRDETVARDVVQETFVRVYFKSGKFEPRSSVKTWVYAIALNLCRDQWRKLSKRRRDVSLDAPGLGDQPALDLPDSTPSPDDAASRRDGFAKLRSAIERLPEKLKVALILFSLDGRSQKEAAEILGITPKAVETRVYHAKEKLRQLLPGSG